MHHTIKAHHNRDEKSTLQQELQEQNRIAADRYALSRAPIVGVLTCVEEDVGYPSIRQGAT